MATFFPGTSEIQADGLQTLYLMNPGYVGYPETGGSGNMVFLNHPTGNSINPANLSPTSQQQSHHFIGIPLPTTPQEPKRQPLSIQQEEPTNGFLPSRHHYNLWRNSGNEFTFLQAIDPESHHQISPQMNNSVNLAATVVQPVAREMSNQLGLKQGLSLTLSSQSQQQQPSSVQFGNFQTESLKQGSVETGELRIASSLRQGGVNCSVSNGTNGLQSIFTSSKYLIAAQQLLDEVVNVGKGIKQVESESPIKPQIKTNKETAGGGDVSGAESSGKRSSELTTVERQELQMKKAKLVGMLEEVDQRYRQYHHQMQIVISSFEAAAGFGSAKTYTALALQTISKQFRCLRDAISGQIRATSKSLGDEDCLGGGRVEGSKLRYVDHHLRQQRALQQLGMMQNNAWRPQRGLPERSVSVLRAWLFEHFLHPYPKDADKIMLAKQTGLTRSQVSNWFINARVRLWKPMVEEMYNEETKEQEETNASDEKTSKSEINEESRLKTNPENSPPRKEQIENSNPKHDHSSDLKSPPHPLAPSASTLTVSTTGNVRTQTGFSLIGSDQQTSFQDRESMRQGNPKKPKNGLQDFNSLSSINVDLKPGHANRDEFCTKFGEDRQNTDGYSLITGPTDHSGRFGAYQIEEMGRFNLENYAPRFSGNGVSLTLGLPHCENLSLSGTQQQFLSNQHLPLGRRFEISSESSDFCNINTPTSAATAFENINTQTRKRFAAQLLRDFVA